MIGSAITVSSRFIDAAINMYTAGSARIAAIGASSNTAGGTHVAAIGVVGAGAGQRKLQRLDNKTIAASLPSLFRNVL